MKYLLIFPLLLACIWDDDTLKDEQRGLPEVAALIEGRFEQHSDFYYEQRLVDEAATLDDWDNHAVALEKLGRVDEAIAALEPIVEQHPDRYTAHANLGTFHIHRYLRDQNTADLDRGIELIERAIEINPDAHFGREKYQLMLAQHVRAAVAGDEVAAGVSFIAVPLTNAEELRPIAETDADFVNIVQEKVDQRRRIGRAAGTGWNEEEIDEAITGVAGMIRFGTGTSPRLFEALGDLLAARGDKQLAGRAYLRAIEFGHPDAERIRAHAASVLASAKELRNAHEPVVVAEREFEEAKASAAAWVAAYQTFEDDLLRRDVPLTDDAYAPFYAEYGNPRDPPAMTLTERTDKFFGDLRVQILIACVVAVLGVTAVSLILRKIARAMRKPSPV